MKIKYVPVLLMALVLAGCSGKTAKTSSEATKERPLVLKLAHNMSQTHTVHIALQDFADQVFAKTDGRIRIDIYPNGQLGSETEVLEQLLAGVIDMTKVSAPGLAPYYEGYHTFGLPFLFDDENDFYNTMDSQVMRDFFNSTVPYGFVGITYYTSGSRSFYTKDKAIRTPADLKGLKIRVQDMKSQIDMMKALGGTPVAMAYGDVYTALQTGIIDGTENNETALTIGKHGEVCKVYSVDQHAMIPDVVVMSAASWKKISPADRQIILDAAASSTQTHKAKWNAAVADAVAEAKEKYGVTFVTDVDKQAFRDATKDMIGTYSAKYPKVKDLLEKINSVPPAAPADAAAVPAAK